MEPSQAAKPSSVVVAVNLLLLFIGPGKGWFTKRAP